VLATGGELKNTFCLAKGRHAFVSHHIGDLENFPTLRSFIRGIEHLGRLFDIRPEVIAHDLHPDYLSTRYALDRLGVDLVGVQHHHAHIASCLADNGHDGPVIGVAFDGTGLGPDGTIWGGEFLVADLATYVRRGHLDPVPMPGGVSAIRQPWRMAVSYLDAAFDGAVPEDLAVLRRHDGAWRQVNAVARQGVNATTTSSAGRLFDAVAAILGVRDSISYEGQAAIELEQCTDLAESGHYTVAIEPGDTIRVAGVDLIRAVVADLRDKVDPAVISARFHRGVAVAIVRVCELLRESTGLSTVALSGGVFQNLVLLDHAVDGLADRGFAVLTHSRVPTNDGGISLGQAVVAAARDRVGPPA
jgi:hydrogenase maturation protein HypF